MLEGHDILHLIGIAGITLSYFLVVVFNTVNAVGGSSIFYNTVGNLSDKYALDITPDGWAFSIWGLIYIWLGLAVAFIIFSVFKTNSEGKSLYMNPPIIDLTLSFTVTLNFSLNIAWVFTWDREDIITSCAILIFMAVSNIVTIGLLCRSLSSNNHELMTSDKIAYWSYVVIMNGYGVYTTWTVIASLLNLGHAVRYEAQVSMQDTSNLCLSLLLVFSVSYFLIENILFDKKLRFLLTPYLVLIWALSAIVTKEATDPFVLDQTKMFVSALLSISSVLFLLRLLLVFFRQRKSPIGKSYDNVDDNGGRRTSTTYGSIF